MTNLSPQLIAGNALRKLIKKHYKSQEDFAWDYHMDIRNISRYVNNGINKFSTIQELADFFHLTWEEFLNYGREDDE